MAFTPPNAGFSEIASHSIKNYRPTLADNLTGHKALLAQIRQKNFVRYEEGGTSIVEQLEYGLNSTVKSYSHFDLLDRTPQNIASAAEFFWKQIHGSVIASGKEIFENMGRTRLINLVTSRLTNLDTSMQLKVSEQLFGDGTGNGGKDITGLNLLAEDGTAWSVYGGIDSSVAGNAFWRNVFVDFDATHTSFATASGTSVEGLAVMRNVWNSAARGKSKPTLIVTTQELYEAYEGYAEGKHLRIGIDKGLLELGFDNIQYKGTPMVFDEDCPTNTMFMLNADYLKLVIGTGKDFAATPFHPVEGQDAQAADVFLFCNLVCSNRARQARISDFIP